MVFVLDHLTRNRSSIVADHYTFLDLVDNGPNRGAENNKKRHVSEVKLVVFPQHRHLDGRVKQRARVVEKFFPHGAKRGAAEVIEDTEKSSFRDRAILENVNNTVVAVVAKVTGEEVCISILGVDRAIFKDVSKSLVGPYRIAE